MTTQINPTGAQLNLGALQGVYGAPTGDVSGDVPVCLTPETLMEYCEARMGDVSTQIQKQMTQQSNRSWEQQKIGELMSEVNALNNTCDKDSSGNSVTKSTADVQKLESDIESAISAIEARDPGCPALADLKQLHDTVMATGTGPYSDGSGYHGFYCSTPSSADPSAPPSGGTAPQGVRNDQDGLLGSDELQNFTATLQNVNATLNSNSQMGMIQIQSLASQQSTIVQLTTNLIQTLNDSTSKVVGNIRS